MKHQTATIAESAVVHRTARIGARTIIGHQVYVGPNVVVGDDCVVESGARLGALPFSISNADATAEDLYPVEIEDNCRVGCNSVLQYGIERPSRLRSGAWVNHQCNIGHDVVIGERSMIGLSTSISGHSTIGNDVKVGPGCTLTNRSTIGDRAVIGIGSLVLHEVNEATTVLGRPAVERSEYLETQKALRELTGHTRAVRRITGSRPASGTRLGELVHSLKRSYAGQAARKLLDRRSSR